MSDTPNSDAIFGKVGSFVPSSRERLEQKRRKWLRLTPAERQAELAVLYQELEDFCRDIKAMLEEAGK